MADKHIRLLVSAEVKDAINKLNKTEKSTNKLVGSFKGLAMRAGLLAGAAALGAVVKSSVSTSAQFEALETRLVALKGSVEGGKEAFQAFNQIAKTTPFQLANVVEAGAQLEAFGANSEESLKAVADLAAFMGTDIVDAANAFGRAFAGGAGAADVLRDRGVLTQVKLKSGFDDLSKLTLPQFRQALEDTLTDPQGNIAGATDLLAKTFSGLVSNFQDSLSQLQDSIGDLLAPAIKRVISVLKTGVDALTEQFKRLGETDLETTIRIVKDLGGEVDQLVIVANKARLVELDLEIGSTTAEEIIKKVSAFEQGILDSVNARAKQQELLNTLSAEELNKLQLVNVEGKTATMTRKAFLEMLIKGNDDVIAQNQQNIIDQKDISLLIKERADLIRQNKELEKDGGGGEDPVAVVMSQEEIKTEILKQAAEKRKEITESEKLSQLSIEDFEAIVANLKITEEQKTAIIKAETDKRKKLEQEAHQKRIEQNLESAILQGQSAKDAAISVVKAEVAEAQASLISSIMQALPFPINLAVAAGAGSMVGKITDQLLSFQTGGSFITKGRTTLPIGSGVVVGDNASGMERVDITPLPSPNDSPRNITINISAPLVDETVVDHIIPAIQRAEKLGL